MLSFGSDFDDREQPKCTALPYLAVFVARCIEVNEDRVITISSRKI